MVHGLHELCFDWLLRDDRSRHRRDLPARRVSLARRSAVSVPVHAFPFRMTDTNMTRHAGSKWTSFWQNLKQGFDAFEHSNVPPSAQVRDGRYVFGGS